MASGLVARGASVLVAVVLELGGGSKTDGRREAMTGNKSLSAVVLLVVPVSTELKGTGVGIGVLDSCDSADDTCLDVGVGVLDSCGSTDDTCSDVVDPLRSGMSGMSGSDTELLEVGVMTAISGALWVDDALKVLEVEGSVESSTEGAVVGATVGVFVDGSTKGSCDDSVVGSLTGAVEGTVDVGVKGSGVASVGEVVEVVEVFKNEKNPPSMGPSSTLELELELESVLPLVTAPEPESPLELEIVLELESALELELELGLELGPELELEPELGSELGVEATLEWLVSEVKWLGSEGSVTGSNSEGSPTSNRCVFACESVLLSESGLPFGEWSE